MKNYIQLLIVILLTNLSCAQNTYKGTIDDWDNKQAEIILPTEEPLVIGKVDTKGTVTLNLSDSLTKTLIDLKKEVDKETGNIKIVGQSVSRSFYCKPEQVNVVNGDIVPIKAVGRGSFYIGDIKAQKLYGQLRIASSEAFNNSYFSFGKKDFVVGYYIDFFYVEEDASVNGICRSESYTMDMKNVVELIVDYNINLKKGWNLVKIEVAETYVDGEKIRPLKTVMSTIEAIPQDAKFILFEQ
ncbi:MAG: hypothetical protein HKN99_10450 [Winogradskyella sp.]|nr:hypothetical protein [Winogradskyella sp.]